MKVLVSGSSGLVGSALVPALCGDGITVGRLVRPGRSAGANDVSWDPSASRIDSDRLRDFDAVVHLAGENIASGRWNARRKELIRRSRVDATLLLCRALARLKRPPHALVAASAIGYYGDRGDEILRETSARGKGFLPAVCVAWESATEPAEAAGLRVVNLRFGVILSRRGGALKKMLLPFRLGMGGRVGTGMQYMSWITIDDVVGVIRFALETQTLTGPVNAVAPNPVRNVEFTRSLGGALHRPTIAPMPAFAARLAFGEMADALLLASTRVVPDALSASRYAFQNPDLDGALRHVLKS